MRFKLILLISCFPFVFWKRLPGNTAGLFSIMSKTFLIPGMTKGNAMKNLHLPVVSIGHIPGTRINYRRFPEPFMRQEKENFLHWSGCVRWKTGRYLQIW